MWEATKVDEQVSAEQKLSKLFRDEEQFELWLSHTDPIFQHVYLDRYDSHYIDWFPIGSFESA